MPTLSSPVSAQFGTVRGFVYEEETGEPVLFTNVYFSKTTLGAPTDENGYFAITRIPPGDYTLLVTYIGFDSLVIPMTIKAGDLIKDVAKIVGGGGGGRPDLAQAGGKDPSKLGEALDTARRLVSEKLSG